MQQLLLYTFQSIFQKVFITNVFLFFTLLLNFHKEVIAKKSAKKNLVVGLVCDKVAENYFQDFFTLYPLS